MTVIHSWKCTVLFSFAVPLAAIGCHALSFVVTGCHLLPLAVPLIVTRCTARCHSLSLVVIRFHSLFH